MFWCIFCRYIIFHKINYSVSEVTPHIYDHTWFLMISSADRACPTDHKIQFCRQRKIQLTETAVESQNKIWNCVSISHPLFIICSIGNKYVLYETNILSWKPIFSLETNGLVSKWNKIWLLIYRKKVKILFDLWSRMLWTISYWVMLLFISFYD